MLSVEGVDLELDVFVEGNGDGFYICLLFYVNRWELEYDIM